MADALLLAAAAGAAAGAAYLALTYMAGSFLQSNAIKSYFKLEMEEFIISLILVLLCLEVYWQHDSLLAPIAGKNLPDAQVSIELGKIADKLYAATVGLAQNNFRLGMLVGYNYNYQVPMPLPVTYIGGTSPTAGASPLVSALLTGSDGLWMIAFLVRTEYVFYLFSKFAAVSYLLPFGVVLRFIPPLRKIGGLLLAGALGIFFVFPAAVLFGGALYPYLMPAAMPALVPYAKTPVANSMICNQIISDLATIGEILGPTGICRLLPFIPPGSPSVPAPIGPGVPGCDYWVSLIWWGIKFAFDAGMAATLPHNAMVLSPDDLVSNYYNPIVNNWLPFALQTGMASMALVLVHVIPLILITRNLAEILSAEGQIYGLSKII